jgi:hypothetical protein
MAIFSFKFPSDWRKRQNHHDAIARAFPKLAKGPILRWGDSERAKLASTGHSALVYENCSCKATTFHFTDDDTDET